MTTRERRGATLRSGSSRSTCPGGRDTRASTGSTGKQARRPARLAALVAGVALLAAACSTTDNGGGGGGGGGGGEKKIALLLPETKTTRYEARDRPLFEAKVKALCSDCQIIYSNADQKADQQLNQADAALTNGAKVMVLDPVDSASAASIVTNARQTLGKMITDGFLKAADICSGPAATACRQLGLVQ